jgi:N-acetylglucosaminyldiphosphoundecaprenol N-acetyl-beta-D-mannosaminyltransferase
MTPADTVSVTGVPVHVLSPDDAAARVAGWIREGKTRRVVTPNAEILAQAAGDWELKQILQTSDLAIPDSTLVVWAMRLAGAWRQRRVTGVDLMQELCRRAVHANWRVFLLGAGPGVAVKAGYQLQRRYPGLHVVGTLEGDPSPEADRATRDAIRTRIGRQPIDLLFVAYGAPKQEKWMARNLPHLPQVRVAMAVGGSFDIYAGDLRRAPETMQKFGLEWLFRTWQEPRRIKRLGRLPLFVWLVFTDRLKRLVGR